MLRGDASVTGGDLTCCAEVLTPKMGMFLSPLYDAGGHLCLVSTLGLEEHRIVCLAGGETLSWAGRVIMVLAIFESPDAIVLPLCWEIVLQEVGEAHKQGLGGGNLQGQRREPLGDA